MISDVVAAGMTMIGVREVRFGGFFDDDDSRGAIGFTRAREGFEG